MCASTADQTRPSLRSLVPASMSGVMNLSLSHGLGYGENGEWVHEVCVNRIVSAWDMGEQGVNKNNQCIWSCFVRLLNGMTHLTTVRTSLYTSSNGAVVVLGRWKSRA